MSNHSKIKRSSLAGLLLLAGCMYLSAQFSNTYYHMFGVPQANQLNPAFQSHCNAYLGLPVLSPIRIEAELPLAYSDVFTFNSSLSQFITFLHPEGDKQDFLDALDKNPAFRVELGFPLLSTGWRKEDFYFTIDFSERADVGITIPGDLGEFLVNGNTNQDRFSFGGFGPELRYFHELAVGVSYNSDDEFQVGGRAKLLFGLANLRNAGSDINLRTGMEEWKINTDVKYDLTLPYLGNLPIDSDGTLLIDSLMNMSAEDLFWLIEDIDVFGLEALHKKEAVKTMLGLKNPGIAVDLGFNYHPIEQLSISASAVDLGMIFWRNQSYRLIQTMDYGFEGLEISLDEDMGEIAEDLLDSIGDLAKNITAENKAYTALLTGKMYYGVAYDLTEKVRFGFVGKTRIYNYNFYNQYTLSANVMPISMFSASVSYSVYNGYYHNLGLGLSLRLGPLNLYFITDQAPSVYLVPRSINSLNFRLGLNLVAGCRKESKKMKDRPLIE